MGIVEVRDGVIRELHRQIPASKHEDPQVKELAWSSGTRLINYTSGSVTAANFVLADEINRAPAKVQSALLEAMQEKQVTVGGVVHPLKPP